MSLVGTLCFFITPAAIWLYAISEPFSKTLVADARIGVVLAQTSRASGALALNAFNQRVQVLRILIRGRVADTANMDRQDTKCLHVRCMVDQISKAAVEVDQVPPGPPGFINRLAIAVNPTEMAVQQSEPSSRCRRSLRGSRWRKSPGPCP